MVTEVEFFSDAGRRRVIVVPARHGANAFYYSAAGRGSDGETRWRFDRVAEIKYPWPRALSIAAAIVNAGGVGK